MSSSFGKKRRPDPIQASRPKQSKGTSKPTVEDLFPFEAPNLQTLAPQIKQYVSQLQKQYIERYNILINNRIIYEQIIQNISTELDEKGVAVPNLAELYRSSIVTRAKSDDNNL